MKTILLIFLVCMAALSAVFCFAQVTRGETIYYVDFLNGSDSNNGRSPVSAFKHCPGDGDASIKAKSTKLSAGDTIIFKGGVVYRGIVDIKQSGTSEARMIVYDGNSRGDYGKGRAIIDGDLIRPQGFISRIKKIKFVKINNFEIRNMKADNVPSVDIAGVLFTSGMERVIIENCYIHHVGTWTNEGKTPIGGNGIRIVEPTQCKVCGCEITKTGGSGIHLMGGVNCIIEDNKIHHYINWGIDIASWGRSSMGNIVRRNVVHDLYQFDAGFWKGDPAKGPHQNFIFIRGGGKGKRSHNNIIDGNLFYNNYDFNDAGGTSMVFLSASDRNLIRNNVFINPHSYFAISVSWGSEDNEIYNNVIWNPRTSGIRINRYKFDGAITIQNNVIVSPNPINWDSEEEERNWKINHNYYLAFPKTQFARVKPYRVFSFRDWQETFGNDKEGKMAKSLQEFKFTRTEGYPTECDKMDFRINPGSILIDKAIKPSGVSHDFSGVRRPQGKGWDVGAHELVVE